MSNHDWSKHMQGWYPTAWNMPAWMRYAKRETVQNSSHVNMGHEAHIARTRQIEQNNAEAEAEAERKKLHDVSQDTDASQDVPNQETTQETTKESKGE